MKLLQKSSFILLLIFSLNLFAGQRSSPLIINHTCTDITQVPQSWIQAAKDKLHIAYGHTSHGSQITDGMTGLVAFANNGGRGLELPENIFAWNNGGTNGALDLHDLAMGGDVGYYPDWVNNTHNYLGEADESGRGKNNPDVNVIIWSWCGQVDAKYAAGTLHSEYLEPMDQLESEYPAVTFIYMTGHVDHWDDANNKAANQVIRDYCIANNKVLFDFAEIECYDPDGNFYQYPNDNCDYYSESGQLLGNWAIEWQNAHSEGEDWYNCGSAHSQPLNANQKAYAAWWMWARLAGWNNVATDVHDEDLVLEKEISLFRNYPNPFNPQTVISYQLPGISKVNLAIYNMAGQKIATLVNKTQNAGIYQVVWDAGNYSSGVYLYKLQTDNGYIETRRMILLR